MADLLLIEDDPHQRALAALVLETAGHAVREAGNGEEGLRMAVENPPELIVCDVLMPGMNGYQLVTAVRKHPVLGATPVVLLTSLAERAQVRVGMNAGADDYLPKPFRPEELVEAVHAVLERRRAQYQAIAGSVKEDMDAALARQREMLAARYEAQLLQELNSRWNSTMASDGQSTFEVATVLAADLFEVIERHGAASADPADLLRRAHQAAGDALYLFGAVHVLPHRPDVLAVFKPDDEGRPTIAQPVRAAFALQAAMARVLGSAHGRPELPSGPTIALDVGPFSLVRLQDPLHGDGGTTPVPGATLERVQALRTFARRRGWAVASTQEATQLVEPALAATGQRAGFRHGTAGEAVAVELLKPQG